MNDTELKEILLGIQSNVIALHGEIAETRSTLHDEIVETKESLQKQMDGMQSRMDGMQKQIDGIHGQIAGIHGQIDGIHGQIDGIHSQIADIYNQIGSLQKSVKKIELTIENEVNVKIGVLFDARMDEIRHRKENMETNARVANLEMRVDNLEKAIIAS